MLMQNLGGQTKSTIVFSKMAYNFYSKIQQVGGKNLETNHLW